jgi:uncharacterized protein YsxB (DUF464 family)
LIEVSRFKGGITIKGHAGYAPSGEDIVCAGVSTLAQTLIASIEALTEDAIQYDIQPGWLELKFRKLSASAKLLIASFFVGIEMIADNYPDNVTLTEH